ncbi:hypothetical protein O181_035443 [Austropuccinia psidii MF-1]|uniref:Uncharacterized protein n=1 Tax=Austropuccinia psidii MF-1 TaxID=1389203 RepID=A0A9Q3H895_9BASI|nr:hypothetical protein [Austropuccinia psidii MF-1]
MESTIIQTSNQNNNKLAQKKGRGKEGRSPISFYQKATSQPISPKGEEELEETMFPKLQGLNNPKGCHEQCLQHGQILDGIQGQRRAKNKITKFPKEISFSSDFVNTLTEIKKSTLPLKKLNKFYHH